MMPRVRAKRTGMAVTGVKRGQSRSPVNLCQVTNPRACQSSVHQIWVLVSGWVVVSRGPNFKIFAFEFEFSSNAVAVW